MDTDQMNIEPCVSNDSRYHGEKIIGIAAAIMAGATLLGVGAYLAWNSRQARMLRATRRAANVMYKTGMVLQSVAEAAK